jgi:formamidopyrimidine-DNA glycosylase
MPELPEVETMRRGILPVVGSRITGVCRVPCARKPILIQPRFDVFRRRALGRAIEAVDRLGKRVILRLDSGDAIIFEPRMTGLVLLAEPPTQEHRRFLLELAGGTARRLWYWDRRGLGSVRLLSPRQFQSQLGQQKLGPDALALTPERLRQRFCNSRRAIKVALLDQRGVAGIGNLYASEILHLAGVHPQQRCDRLTRKQWQQLHAAVVEVLEAAIRLEGSTLSDGTYRNALNNPGGYQNHHRVYGRQGERCSTCQQASVERIVQAQRSTFFCRSCQPKWPVGTRRKTTA